MAAAEADVADLELKVKAGTALGTQLTDHAVLRAACNGNQHNTEVSRGAASAEQAQRRLQGPLAEQIRIAEERLAQVTPRPSISMLPVVISTRRELDNTQAALAATKTQLDGAEARQQELLRKQPATLVLNCHSPTDTIYDTEVLDGGQKQFSSQADRDKFLRSEVSAGSEGTGMKEGTGFHELIHCSCHAACAEQLRKASGTVEFQGYRIAFWFHWSYACALFEPEVLVLLSALPFRLVLAPACLLPAAHRLRCSTQCYVLFLIASLQAVIGDEERRQAEAAEKEQEMQAKLVELGKVGLRIKFKASGGSHAMYAGKARDGFQCLGREGGKATQSCQGITSDACRAGQGGRPHGVQPRGGMDFNAKYAGQGKWRGCAEFSGETQVMLAELDRLGGLIGASMGCSQGGVSFDVNV
eukprot:1158468-Pelagomonas_calceolata.AAC.4